MTVELSPLTVLALDQAVRRALAELESCAEERRVHADWVRCRWRGRRRDDFDAAAAELDAAARRAIGDLRALSRVTARLAADAR